MPQPPVEPNILLPIGADLDHGQAGLPQTMGVSLPESLPGIRPFKMAAIHRYHMGVIQSHRSTVEGFKGCGVRLTCLRQKRKNPTAFIINHDNSDIQRIQFGSEKTVQIVIEREVPQHQGDPVAGCSNSHSSRDDSVDAVASPVAHGPNLTGRIEQKGVQIANRHTVPSKENTSLWYLFRHFRNDAPLEGLLKSAGYSQPFPGP